MLQQETILILNLLGEGSIHCLSESFMPFLPTSWAHYSLSLVSHMQGLHRDALGVGGYKTAVVHLL